jgi:hypothetical protein
MTFEERVEKAAAKLAECETGFPDAEICVSHRTDARAVLLAAFPDLYGEKPTHEIISHDLLRELASRPFG